MANPPRSGTPAGPGATPGSGAKGGAAGAGPIRGGSQSHGRGGTPGGGPTRSAGPALGPGAVSAASRSRSGVPSPGAGAPPGAAPLTRPGRKALRTPRKAQRIKWSPQEIRESRSGRWVFTGFVGIVLILGVLGWYWYLTRPRLPVPEVQAVLEPGASTPAEPPHGAVPAGVPRPSTPSRIPIGLTPKELREAILSHAPQPVDHAYAMYYQGREVTWAGSVSSSEWQDRLLRVDLRDDDGLRVIAWCEAGAEPKPGTRVTVRGRVTTKLADGFVVERCEVL
jgi:hypothetical protein